MPLWKQAGWSSCCGQRPAGGGCWRPRRGGSGVWLVGGAVRDMLLGNAPRELDVAVEGDVGAAGARRSAARSPRTSASARRPSRTATAASTSRARAPRPTRRPGALPEVHLGAARRTTCARRDVTVNAIAVAARRRRASRAWPGRARRPARRRPARAARALVRRRPDARLARRALRGAARASASTRSTARARRGRRARARSAASGSGTSCASRSPSPTRRAVFEQLAGAEPARAARRASSARPPALARGARAAARRTGARDLHVLAACCAGMDAGLLARWLDHLQFTGRRPRRRRRRLALGHRRAAARGAARRARSRRAARGAPVEAVALAGGDNARRWLDELRHVRPAISGDDLLAAGVPAGPGGRARACARRWTHASTSARSAATPSSRSRSPSRRSRFRQPMRPLNDLRWDGGARPLRGLVPDAHRPRLGLRASGSASRCTRPLDGPADCSLWFAAMDRDGTRFGSREVVPGRPAARGESDPFRLVIGGRRAVGPRHRRRLRRRALGAALDARRRARAAGAPARRAREARARRCT